MLTSAVFLTDAWPPSLRPVLLPSLRPVLLSLPLPLYPLLYTRELEEEYVKCSKDPEFKAEFEALGRDYVGRATPMYYSERLTKHCGGARIWLKREDLAHTGAHKINNALGQALLAKKLGKTRMWVLSNRASPDLLCSALLCSALKRNSHKRDSIAETGAGQHGVATATACALLGMPCVVYMGEVDMERQKLNVFRMRILGTEVRGVKSGSRTLKDAVNEALRDWVTNVRTTHYIIGSAIGPHPFPAIVRDFQSVIGRESRKQMLEQVGADGA